MCFLFIQCIMTPWLCLIDLREPCIDRVGLLCLLSVMNDAWNVFCSSCCDKLMDSCRAIPFACFCCKCPTVCHLLSMLSSIIRVMFSLLPCHISLSLLFVLFSLLIHHSQFYHDASSCPLRGAFKPTLAAHKKKNTGSSLISARPVHWCSRGVLAQGSGSKMHTSLFICFNFWFCVVQHLALQWCPINYMQVTGGMSCIV